SAEGLDADSFRLEVTFREGRGFSPNGLVADPIDHDHPDHDTSYPPVCSAKFVERNSYFYLDQVKTGKINGDDREAVCAKALADKLSDSKVVWAAIGHGGLFKKWCRVESVEFLKYQ